MAHAIDWVAARREAQGLLTDYLRIDTSNPPGNEALGARFLGALLEAEGIPTRYLETAPGREILYARIPGEASSGAFMLCNHIDTVPVELDYWTKPAFVGLEEGNRIYGRGAVDMKAFAVMQLLAVLLLRRQGVSLKRDLVFCAVPDEEALGTYGMRWLCDHHPELVDDIEFELNEGGSGSNEFQGSDREVYAPRTRNRSAGCASPRWGFRVTARWHTSLARTPRSSWRAPSSGSSSGSGPSWWCRRPAPG